MCSAGPGVEQVRGRRHERAARRFITRRGALLIASAALAGPHDLSPTTYLHRHELPKALSPPRNSILRIQLLPKINSPSKEKCISPSVLNMKRDSWRHTSLRRSRWNWSGNWAVYEFLMNTSTKVVRFDDVPCLRHPKDRDLIPRFTIIELLLGTIYVCLNVSTFGMNNSG